jgi:hypothetical protein
MNLLEFVTPESRDFIREGIAYPAGKIYEFMGLRKDASPDSHQRVAIFGALLFAVHPVHVEAVPWLAARKEVLQGFFFFVAFYFYLH